MGYRILSFALAFVSMASIGMQARAASKATERALCFAESEGGDWSIEISEVGEGMLLPAGIYLSVKHRSPWQRVTLFRVRSGIESASELMNRVASARRSWEDGGERRFASLEGIRFSAVGVDTTATADNRGAYALVLNGSGLRIGDSFHSEVDESLGKYSSAEIASCL